MSSPAGRLDSEQQQKQVSEHGLAWQGDYTARTNTQEEAHRFLNMGSHSREATQEDNMFRNIRTTHMNTSNTNITYIKRA